MDQGTAALIAGLAGALGALGGALTGGIAAVRGARIGAETAAVAARQQVQDQAATEHAHWLRERRQETYGIFLAAAQEVQRMAQPLVVALYVEQRRDSQLNDAQQAVSKLCDLGNNVSLIGPDRILPCLQRAIHCVVQLDHVLVSSFVAPEVDRDAIHASLSEYEEAKADFVSAAREILGGVRN
ncbi:hypothetical protein ACTFBT_20695 [Streptomyces microflavus]|uniref:Uncharacterized protein n=1 Tax=Streptomyces microflavus TaxID=1919 RepID=A0A7J0CST7_STRMI|nr:MULTISPECIES: hypothetical protein [Streptomyces]MDX2979310.1 hypothetical protein [Streptomyces sp. NRRL_B-2249]GFN05590.1 hypothetical protein Smic_41460 [Streptomyces microflavus]GGX53712.1 hypothetical protein GCM10010298_17170 [Streptomyces microflavus]